VKSHNHKFQPVTLFGKLVGALLIFSCGLTWAEPAPAILSGTATIQLKNSDSPQNLSGMDIVLAPPSLIPEIRRLRMETWRTEGLAIKRNDTPKNHAQLAATGPRSRFCKTHDMATVRVFLGASSAEFLTSLEYPAGGGNPYSILMF